MRGLLIAVVIDVIYVRSNAHKGMVYIAVSELVVVMSVSTLHLVATSNLISNLM